MSFVPSDDLAKILLKQDFGPAYELMIIKMSSRIPKYGWGYQTCEVEGLKARLKEEFEELSEKGYDDLNELVDVANIAMMLIYRKLEVNE